MRTLLAFLIVLALLPAASALAVVADADPGLPVLGGVRVAASREGVTVEGPVEADLPLKGPRDARVGVSMPGFASTPGARAASSDVPPRERVVEAAAPVAAAAAAGLLLGKLGLWRVVGGMAIALYSRISPGETLNHKHRARMVDLIRETPGIALNDLHARTGLGWGTTIYHLERLERAGLVASERVGNARRYFLPGLTPPAEREAQGLLRTERARALARFVAENPGATQSEAASALSLSKSDASKAMAKLEEAGLVRREREGRFARAYPGDALPGLLAA